MSAFAQCRGPQHVARLAVVCTTFRLWCGYASGLAVPRDEYGKHRLRASLRAPARVNSCLRVDVVVQASASTSTCALTRSHLSTLALWHCLLCETRYTVHLYSLSCCMALGFMVSRAGDWTDGLSYLGPLPFRNFICPTETHSDITCDLQSSKLPFLRLSSVPMLFARPSPVWERRLSSSLPLCNKSSPLMARPQFSSCATLVSSPIRLRTNTPGSASTCPM